MSKNASHQPLNCQTKLKDTLKRRHDQEVSVSTAPSGTRLYCSSAKGHYATDEISLWLAFSHHQSCMLLVLCLHLLYVCIFLFLFIFACILIYIFSFPCNFLLSTLLETSYCCSLCSRFVLIFLLHRYF